VLSAPSVVFFSEVPGGSLFTTEGTEDTEGEGAWCSSGPWGDGERHSGKGGKPRREGGRDEEEEGVGGRCPPVFLSALSVPSVVFLRRFRVVPVHHGAVYIEKSSLGYKRHPGRMTFG